MSVSADLEGIVDSHRSALLVYDMQVGILSQIDDGERVAKACVTAVAAARRAGIRVVYTRHLSSPRCWMGSTQLRTAMAWQKTDDPAAITPWFPRNASATAIAPELAPTDNDLVIDKYAMSAFEGTSLAFAMRDCGLTNVIICGVALEIGIEPTVRHATDLGFVPVVLTDACGAGHAEAGQRTMETMRFIGEAVLMNVATLCSLVFR